MQYFLARKYVQDKLEYEEVMEMIRTKSGEVGGIFDRIELMGIEKGRREGRELERKESKEKFNKKIELMENEMKKRGYDIKEIQTLTQIIK